jgi:hypothetical protein
MMPSWGRSAMEARKGDRREGQSEFEVWPIEAAHSLVDGRARLHPHRRSRLGEKKHRPKTKSEQSEPLSCNRHEQDIIITRQGGRTRWTREDRLKQRLRKTESYSERKSELKINLERPKAETRQIMKGDPIQRRAVPHATGDRLRSNKISIRGHRNLAKALK